MCVECKYTEIGRSHRKNKSITWLNWIQFDRKEKINAREWNQNRETKIRRILTLESKKKLGPESMKKHIRNQNWLLPRIHTTINSKTIDFCMKTKQRRSQTWSKYLRDSWIGSHQEERKNIRRTKRETAINRSIFFLHTILPFSGCAKETNKKKYDRERTSFFKHTVAYKHARSRI